MSQCTTTSGAYRCKHGAGHPGECEADDMSGATFGPYREMGLARAYLRGVLDALRCEGLSAFGATRMRTPRTEGEPDATYRERLWQIVERRTP